MSGSRLLLAALALVAALTVAGLLRQGTFRAPSASPDQSGPRAFLAVTNPNRLPVDVSVSFAPIDGACDPRISTWRDGRVLEPGAIGFFDTGPGGRAGLPVDCALSATIQSSGGPVAALALSEWEGSGPPAALLAVAEDSATRLSLLPAWTRPRTGSDASRVLARLLGDAPARLQLRLFDSQGQELRGCGADCTRTLSPGQATMWRLESLPGLSPGQFGSAWIESDGPLLSVVASRAGLEGQGFGPLLYAGVADAGSGGNASQAMFPELPKQALAAPVALRRTMGQGASWLSLQAGGSAVKRLRLSLTDGDGQPAGEAAPGDLEAGRAVRLDLDELVDLGQGAHAGLAEATDSLAALVALRWPQVKTGAAYTAPQPARDLVLPIVWRGQPGRASWLTIQGGEALASVTLELYAAGGGEKPVASLQTRVAARGFTSIDLEEDRFAPAGQGFTGWLRVRADSPVGVLGFLADSSSGSPAIAAYPAAPVTALAELLHAALIFSGRPDASQPETPMPRATETPLPQQRPSPTATAASQLDPASGFAMLFDARGFGPGVRVLALGLGEDGSIWLRLRGRAGQERIVRIAPDGSQQRFDGPADALEQGAALARRAGSLPGLWSVDPAGRLWIGARFLEGAGLRVLARDQAEPDGGLKLLDRVLLDRAGRAWVPRLADTDCARPAGCALTSLVAFDAQGRVAGGIDLARDRPRGRGAIDDAALLGSRGGGPISVQAQPGAEARDRAPASLEQGDPDAFVVDADAFYALPDPKPIDYPGLGQPADPTALRNAGYATAAGRDGFGRPVAFTWLEIQSRAGDRVEPELRMNTWVPASADWLPAQALAGPGLPGSPLDPASDQIRAAAWCPDGGLWLGTEQGVVARWDGQAFGERLRPGLTPLPAAPVGALACSATNELLIATADGLYRYLGGTIEPGYEITLPFLVQRRR